MKQDRIKQALKKYHHEGSDTILLEVISGTPRSEEGGVWVEARVEDMETLTEDPTFDRDKSGWGKYLDKFEAEGLITKKEKDTGKA